MPSFPTSRRSTAASRPISRRRVWTSAAAIVTPLLIGLWAFSTARAESPAGPPPEMTPYTELIGGTDVRFDMVPIPGGSFSMGSPDSETDRHDDEGPRHAVQVEPFWMGKCEVTWNEYEIWAFSLDVQRRELARQSPTERDGRADAITRPTKPYTDMSFGMGKSGYPAICMTQLAARTYCRWLSEKTGRYYRLPTEAEWEYACRAGTVTAYHFGDDSAELENYDWYARNAGDAYHKVGQKKPNPWGLHDMHGNVCEWTLDQYLPGAYAARSGQATKNPLEIARQEYPRAVRGGSWQDDAGRCRAATRRGSSPDWKEQDPQMPQSRWYFTDALFVGFRVARPLREPTADEKQQTWEAAADVTPRK